MAPDRVSGHWCPLLLLSLTVPLHTQRGQRRTAGTPYLTRVCGYLKPRSRLKCHVSRPRMTRHKTQEEERRRSARPPARRDPGPCRLAPAQRDPPPLVRYTVRYFYDRSGVTSDEPRARARHKSCVTAHRYGAPILRAASHSATFTGANTKLAITTWPR